MWLWFYFVLKIELTNTLLGKCAHVNITEHFWLQVNISSCNDFVLPWLPQPMLTQTFVAVWRH